ncbi:MAG: glycoside hydrolase, partial [Actinomycetota bacterium]|nr:glycoside hydrolase [Actinomycetota bacterium]
MLLGAGAVLLAGTAGGRSRPAERVFGHDAPVNLGARNPSDINAHNSPTVVRNPTRPGNLAVSSRIDTPFYSCGLHVSFDGGSTWSQTPVPAPKGEEAKCFAPDVAFSSDGTLHLSFVTLSGRGNVPHATWVASSKDGGRTLSKPVRVLGPLAFQVRLAADPVKPGRLYMTWLQARAVGRLKFTTLDNPIQAARSDDGGASWSAPVRVSSPARQRVVTPSPMVGRKGDLYVLYLDLGGDALDYAAGHGGKGGQPYQGHFKLVLGRSRDQGRTWRESVVDD